MTHKTSVPSHDDFRRVSSRALPGANRIPSYMHPTNTIVTVCLNHEYASFHDLIDDVKKAYTLSTKS